MGFTYIRKCAMACWTGGERQGMRVKSILAFLLRLGTHIVLVRRGKYFSDRNRDRSSLLGNCEICALTYIEEKNRFISTLRMKKTHIVLEKEGGVEEGQRWGVVYVGRWLSCRDQLALQSKDNKWKPHSTLAAGGVVSDFRKVKEGDGLWSLVKVKSLRNLNLTLFLDIVFNMLIQLRNPPREYHPKVC